MNIGAACKGVKSVDNDFRYSYIDTTVKNRIHTYYLYLLLYAIYFAQYDVIVLSKIFTPKDDNRHFIPWKKVTIFHS